MKSFLSAITLAATPLLALAVGAAPAQADPSHDGAATIIRGAGCTMRTNTDGSASIRTTDMKAVITPSGRVNLVCHGQVAAGTVEPFQQSGFSCAVGPAGRTTDSHVVWTASGQGTLTCQGTIPKP
jgi:hypothetical protein